MGTRKPILLIDNYDSFTWNLFQMLAQITGIEPVVVRNDFDGDIDIEDYDRIVLSPGPGSPENSANFGICEQFLEQQKVPVLGVCLGHQGLGAHFGAKVGRSPTPMHGRKSTVKHQGTALFENIPESFDVVRYHSLTLELPLPDDLEALAWVGDDLIMAIRHKNLPFWGGQFHPESISTQYGEQLLTNFCNLGLAAGNKIQRRSRREGLFLERSENTSLNLIVRKVPKLYDAEQVQTNFYSKTSPSFWLDSSLLKEGLSRFSFMGAADGPLGFEVSYRVSEALVRLKRGEFEIVYEGSIFDYLTCKLKDYAITEDELPFDFTGGFVGYLGYELKADTEGMAAHQSDQPDARLLFIDRYIVFDHQEKETYVIAVADALSQGEQTRWLDGMLESLEAMEPSDAPRLGESVEPIELKLSRDRGEYLQDIGVCLDEIRAGETYEVCLTNRIKIDQEVSAKDFYRVLRKSNPAPYAAFLDWGNCAVVSSSPERFLKINRDRIVESKPIKGTLPRGKTREEDARLAKALASSEKDQAENLMIVDLVRNDLGRTCQIGSVHVPKLMNVESYATVHQLVSTVRGRLSDWVSSVDTIREAFPGGSMTGAPKVRTMEIIDQLEGQARGIYSGSIGFLSLNGCVDLNIVIRTAVITKTEVSFGVGGAIIALSDPEDECDETVLKAKALLFALSKVIHGRCSPDKILFNGHPLIHSSSEKDLSSVLPSGVPKEQKRSAVSNTSSELQALSSRENSILVKSANKLAEPVLNADTA